MNMYKSILDTQKEFIYKNGFIKVEERIKQLNALKATIQKYELEIIEALNKDLGKSEFEGFSTEIGLIYRSINHTLKNIKKWNKRNGQNNKRLR